MLLPISDHVAHFLQRLCSPTANSQPDFLQCSPAISLKCNKNLENTFLPELQGKKQVLLSSHSSFGSIFTVFSFVDFKAYNASIDGDDG